jgi:hypothetical protein
MAAPSEFLFSYGTLQLETVQRSTFGRILSGTPDALAGFEQAMMAIEDPEVVRTSGLSHHPIVRYTGRAGDTVTGTVFKITAEELQSADRYEVAAYRRIGVTLASGIQGWVYVDAGHAPPA